MKDWTFLHVGTRLGWFWLVQVGTHLCTHSYTHTHTGQTESFWVGERIPTPMKTEHTSTSVQQPWHWGNLLSDNISIKNAHL